MKYQSEDADTTNIGGNIMIQTGGRTDIMVQWFSKNYIMRHKDIFDHVTVGPDEVLFLMKMGKIGEVVTESQVKTTPGILSRIKQFLFGSEDVQLFMINRKPTTLRIPFKSYSKDRTEIAGVANIVIRFSKNDATSVLNLISIPSMCSQKWAIEDTGNIKEITYEDLENILQSHANISIDANAISKYTSSEITDKRKEISEEIADVLKRETPYWNNSGIGIEHVSVEISENAFEEVERYRDAINKGQMMRDIAFNEDRNIDDVATNLKKIKIRNEADIDLVKKISILEIDAAVINKKFEMEDNALEVKYRREIDALIHELEGEKLRASGEGDIAILTEEKNTQLKRLQIDLEKFEKSHNREQMLEDHAVEIKMREALANQEFREKEMDLSLKHRDKDKDTEQLQKAMEMRIAHENANAGWKVEELKTQMQLEDLKKSHALELESVRSKAYLEGMLDGQEREANKNIAFNETQSRNLAAVNQNRQSKESTVTINRNGGYDDLRMNNRIENGCDACADSLADGNRFCYKCGKKLI